jgi:hypothetical protein
MTKQYRITILEKVKGNQRKRVQERLNGYGGKQIAPGAWKIHLTAERLEEIRRLHARPGNEVVRIEVDD